MICEPEEAAQTATAAEPAKRPDPSDHVSGKPRQSQTEHYRAALDLAGGAWLVAPGHNGARRWADISSRISQSA